MFRNKWDYFHFFGPLIVGEVLLCLNLHIFFVGWNFFPFLWEWWDRHKPLEGSPQANKLPKWTHSFLVSDSKFDDYDMMLGIAGNLLALIIYGIIIYLGIL